jgi:hypothetical protein
MGENGTGWNPPFTSDASDTDVAGRSEVIPADQVPPTVSSEDRTTTYAPTATAAARRIARTAHRTDAGNGLDIGMDWA